MKSERIAALRALAEEAELERRDFLYEATEQLRRFVDANRDRLREIGAMVLVDDDQDYLVYRPIEEIWVTRLTYQDPADSEWYDEEQAVEAVSEIVELYNPADIFSWMVEAARNPTEHLLPADELAPDEAPDKGEGADADADEEQAEGDWQRDLPPRQQEQIAAQRLWQLADAYRGQLSSQQTQSLREFASNAEEVLARTGDLLLLDDGEDVLLLRADGRFETSLDLTDLPAGAAHSIEAHRSDLTVVDARAVAEFYDPADVLGWVTDALGERYPHVDFSAVYE